MSNKLGRLRERGQGINDKLIAVLPKASGIATTVGVFNPKLGKALGIGLGILAMLSDAFKIQDAPPAIDAELHTSEAGETLTNE